jgi:isoleucyl-tRNA synthetase
MIWTTTPWTLPASMAVAFHPDFEYVAVGGDDPHGDAYIIESRRQGPVVEATGLDAPKILARIPGKALRKIQIHHPFLDRASVPVMANYVTAEDGTGAVHTAPGHGREDYQTGVQYGIDIYCPVDESGKIFEGLPEYVGKRVFDANRPIVELLKARGMLVGPAGTLEHSYPHCWRCHNPIIFRAAEQWFINMDHRELRQRALEEIKKTRWVPAWGEERISNMIAERPDWCISRQRVWGVPITVFHCLDCKKPILDADLAQHALELFRKEGADAWYAHTEAELLLPGAHCPECGGTNLRRETDILDVWFDSGSSHYAVLGHRWDLPWPSDIYLEAGDQYRGWFHSSLLVALGTYGAAPYHQVLTHGWVLDAQGRAMSKSIGNVIEPQEVIKTHGAEILRLWAASVEFGDDVSISPEMLTRLSEAYRKLRNTFRYCLGNLYDFDPAKDSVEASQLEEIDAWALERTADLLERAQAAYDEYAFHRVYRGVYDFATVDLSAFYFDILKDRLYTAPAKSIRRRAAQTTLYRIADALVRVVAPLLSFTAEEVWTHLPAPQLREKSVHLAQYVSPADLRAGLSAEHVQRLENWPRLMAVREAVLKELEDKRQKKFIGGSLEARVLLAVRDLKEDDLIPAPPVSLGEQVIGEVQPLVEEYRDFLRYLFIVSQVEIATQPVEGATATGLPGLSVKIERAAGQKCDRCWNYSEQVGKDERYPTVCERCSAALKEIEKSSD